MKKTTLAIVLATLCLNFSIKAQESVKPPPLKNQAVMGKVISAATGESLPGAVIKIATTNHTVVTNDRGEFVLTLSNGSYNLSVHYLNHTTKNVTIHIPLKEKLVISLDPNEQDLKEVEINAGYYTVKERERTGSISRVDAKTIGQQPVSNPLAALIGRVPGLVITQNSGVPGSGFSVQIRGQGSLVQGTDPLFVIDGVPFSAGNSPLSTIANAAISGSSNGASPFNMINPSDIESIEVLKDADATSIYGSRGANGVILITTKRGKNVGTQVTANLYSGVSKITRSMDMLNTQQYIEMRKEAFKNDGTIPNTSNAPDLTLWDNNRYTDFKKLLIGGAAYTNNVQLSLNGGNSFTQFLLSGGYHKEGTVFPGKQFTDRGSVNLNLNHQSSNGKLIINIQTNYSANQSTLTGQDLTSSISLPPNLLLYDGDDNLNWEEAGVAFDLSIMNPLAQVNNIYLGKFKNLVSSLNMGYELFGDLKLKTNLGYNTTTGEDQNLSPSTSINPISGVLPYSQFGKSFQNSFIIEPQVIYDKKIENSSLNFIIGATFQRNIKNSISVIGSDYNSDILLGSIAAAGNATARNTDVKYRYNAIYSRLNYNLESRYIFNLTGRRDGSSRFGPNKQFSNFGAIGTAWLFSKESFIQKITPFLSFGKIRASYGITGNDQIGDYKYLNTWTNSNQPYQGIPGIQPSSLYNPDFEWERNRKAEVAIDLGLINDKLLLSAAYFNNRSSNQLVNYQLPAQTGFITILKNLDAIIENTGLEFSFTSKIIGSNALGWSMSGNLTLPKNKLVSFNDLKKSSYANSYVIGEPLSTGIKKFKYLGVNSQTGLYSFLDVNNDGFYDINDRFVTINTDPKFYGGFQNNFTYRSFELNIFFEFKKQLGTNYLKQQSVYIPSFTIRNQPEIILDRWKTIGNQSNIQRLGVDGTSLVIDPALNLVESDAIYSDASYVRLKNIECSYNFIPSILKKLRIEHLKLYMQGQNLITLTNYIGSDPENQNLYSLPPLRTLTVGVQLIF